MDGAIGAHNSGAGPVTPPGESGSAAPANLTHVDERGQARMVDVGAKPATPRRAVAEGFVRASGEALRLIEEARTAKGDVLATARLAGIMAAKRTAELIPLCHLIPLDSVRVDLSVDRTAGHVRIEAEARATWRTGVEMEALTAVAVAALTVYDMVKSADRFAVIGEVRLLAKSGGRHGEVVRPTT